MKSSDKLLCIAIAIIGLLITMHIGILQPTQVIASPEPVNLSRFNHNQKLDLMIDLNSGKADIKTNSGFTDINTTVNHPAKDVGLSSVKPVIIKVPVYETKTEYLTKTVMFPLETPRFHKPSISKEQKFKQ